MIGIIITLLSVGFILYIAATDLNAPRGRDKTPDRELDSGL
jgi:hypothetical protein